jgi:hypothetical protein
MIGMTNRLVSQPVEGGFLAESSDGSTGKGSDVYWSLRGKEDERTERSAPLIERVLPVNPEDEFGDGTVQFVEETLPDKRIAADKTVWIHYLRAWTA